jgi:regulator of sigma E protease
MVHEIGHYKAAKSVGIKVNEFAMGMGPTIYKKEKNGTVYSVRLIPIGGFVLMEGEEEDVKSPTSYSTKSVWKRFKVVAAGPVMNYLLALVLFMIVAFSFGVYGNTVGQIDENLNEYKTGIRSGDKIISVNGRSSYIWEDIYFEIINEDNKSYTAESKGTER